MSRTVKSTHRSGGRIYILAGIVIALFIALGVALSATRATPQAARTPAAPHFVDTSESEHHAAGSGRTVVIAGLGETVPGISGETGPLMTNLVSGTLPDSATQATVRTDENCAPDQAGVSHCLNALDLGGEQVVVQHHHQMSLTPCLTPGEVVNIVTADAYQAQS